MTKLYIKRSELGTSYFKDEHYTIRHRENGPAIEYKGGSKCWYLNGKPHRVNGPAVELFEGYKSWWLEGEQYSEEEHKRLVKMINFL